MELETLLKASEEKGYKVNKYLGRTNDGGDIIDINRGQCEGTTIVVNPDGSYYNIYTSNPCGSTHYKDIQSLYDSIIESKKTGTYKANPSHWRY